MMATFDPGNALCFAAALLLFVLAVGVPAAICEWRDHTGRAAKQREQALVKLHIFANELKQLAIAQRMLDATA